MRLCVRSVIEQGKTSPFARDFLITALEKFEGKEVLITVETSYPSISDKQIRFMHGFFLTALWQARKEAGEEITQEKSRNDFKKRYGPYEVQRDEKGAPVFDAAGFMVHQPKSVAKWTTKEAEDAMEKCRADYATFVTLPVPNEDLTPDQQGANHG